MLLAILFSVLAVLLVLRHRSRQKDRRQQATHQRLTLAHQISSRATHKEWDLDH